MDPGLSSEASAGAEKITVVLVDDQRVVREGLAMVLGLMADVEILGSASDGEEALALVARLEPQVALMDLRMPRLDGVEATRRIAELHPQTKVVVLTTCADDHTVIQALRAGASGFLTKDATSQQIRDALAARPRSTPPSSTTVTETTVKSHINHLYAKTGARDRARAVAYAYRNGLAPDAREPGS